MKHGKTIPSAAPIAALDSESEPVSNNYAAALRRTHCVVMFLLCFASLILHGCGGLTAFTDGSIPNGRSVIRGRVVTAKDPTVAVPNAIVTVTSTPLDNGTATFRVRTDANGAFSIGNIPTGKISTAVPDPTTNVNILVEPADGTLQAQRLSLPLTKDRPVNALVALPATGFDTSLVGSVRIVPTTPTSTTGPQVQFTAQVLDKAGNDLGIFPTLLLDGSDLLVLDNHTFAAVGIGTIPSTSVVTATFGTSFGNQTSNPLPIQINRPPDTPGIPSPPAPPTQ